MRCLRIIMAVAIFIAFAIALPTFLCGCDAMLQPNCIRYYVLNVVIVGHMVQHRTCSYCVFQSCIPMCTGKSCTTVCSCGAYAYYDCFNSYAFAEFEKNGYRTCQILVDTGIRKAAVAYNDAVYSYKNGSTPIMYIEKTTYNCFTASEVQILARVGFAFFIIMGVLLLTWGCIETYMWYKNSATFVMG